MALTDQWYLKYGEGEWLEKATECLKGMNLYNDDNLRAFNHTMGWLKQVTRTNQTNQKNPNQTKYPQVGTHLATNDMMRGTLEHCLLLLEGTTHKRLRIERAVG